LYAIAEKKLFPPCFRVREQGKHPSFWEQRHFGPLD
jgi:hypothetical protein